MILNEISKKTLKSYLKKIKGENKDYSTPEKFRARVKGEYLAKAKLNPKKKKQPAKVLATEGLFRKPIDNESPKQKKALSDIHKIIFGRDGNKKAWDVMKKDDEKAKRINSLSNVLDKGPKTQKEETTMETRKLVEGIVNKNLTEASQVFQEIMESLATKKLAEQKQILGSKLYNEEKEYPEGHDGTWKDESIDASEEEKKKKKIVVVKKK